MRVSVCLPACVCVYSCVCDLVLRGIRAALSASAILASACAAADATAAAAGPGRETHAGVGGGQDPLRLHVRLSRVWALGFRV